MEARLNYTLTFKTSAHNCCCITPTQMLLAQVSHTTKLAMDGGNHFAFQEYPSLHDKGHVLSILLWGGVSIVANCGDH